MGPRRTRRDLSNYETYRFNEGLTECVRGPLLRQQTRRDLSKYEPIVSKKDRVRARAANLLQHTLRRQRTRRDPSNYETNRFNEGQSACAGR